MAIFRVEINMIEQGYVDVEAKDKKEAIDKAQDEADNGGFIGNNSFAEFTGRVAKIA